VWQEIGSPIAISDVRIARNLASHCHVRTLLETVAKRYSRQVKVITGNSSHCRLKKPRPDVSHYPSVLHYGRRKEKEDFR